MFSSNCCFLTCIQMSQEAGQVIWYSHVFKNFPQFVVIHTVKGFGIVNKAGVDFFFWNSPTFLMIQQMLAIWTLVTLPFLNPAWIAQSSQFMHCWSLAWKILSITLLNSTRLDLNFIEISGGNIERKWDPQGFSTAAIQSDGLLLFVSLMRLNIPWYGLFR